ncbi:MAG: T9SS type A sorting domain-containing protein [Balneola sp.]
MKRLYFIILFCLFGSSISAQERYFHELRGLEDSTGTTQLFFQIHETPEEGEQFNYRYDHIYHFDVVTNTYYKLFNNFYEEWTIPGMYTASYTTDYHFFDNDPSKWIRMITNGEGSAPSFHDHRNAGFGFPFPIIIKAQMNNEFYYAANKFLLSIANDSLYYITDDFTVPFSPDSSKWPYFDDEHTGYDEMISYFDSTHFDYRLLAIHPENDSLYFGINENGALFRSEKYSSDFELADSSMFFSALFFDQNPSYIYGRNANTLRISNNGGIQGSWNEITLPESLNKLLFVSTDTSTSGSLFISDSSSVYHSSDYGSSFEMLLEFDSQITGLYKKPDSDILYVLTRTDLYKVENGQPTSIKQVPVSNETTPDIPASVSLKQNYPNPFNPTTTIEYELDKTTFTKLTVFDVLGRKVRELVNEIRPAGTNTIEFNATNLASGVYLYRLEANGVVQTKRLTLIK